MKGKAANIPKDNNESLKRSLDSIDGIVFFSQDTRPSNQLQQMEKEFEMTLANYDRDVQEEVKYILIELLEYPSSSDAQDHQHANRLGFYDLKSSEQGLTEIALTQSNEKKFCKDCGLVVQPSQIPLCTSFDQFPKMGVAAYLYFQNIKNLIILLFLLACFYCSYALYINVTEPSSTIDFDNFINKMSIASTIQNLGNNPSLYNAMFIEGWLVVGGVAVWWLALFLMKKATLKHERMVDDMTITAADFSIMLEHIPVTFTKESLQKELDRYFEEIKDHVEIHGKENLRPFTIRKFCKATPFYFLDEQSIQEKIEEIQEKMSELREKISQLIEEVKKKGNFKTQNEQRKKMYAEYIKLGEQKVQHQKDLKQLSKNFNCLQNAELTTAAFIVFQCSQSANAIEIANPRGFGAILRYYLTCCKSGIYFLSDMGVTTCRAPQPQDIIWQNIGIPDKQVRKRKLLTYFVTLILLGISFGVAYGFTMLQMTYSSFIFSYAISFSITIINMFIDIAIRALTVYESDITHTQQQVGLAMKSIFAQLINSTLIPVITNIYIEKNMYDVDGLIYDVFYLSLNAALIPPLFKVFDVYYRIQQIMICYYNNSPYAKLAMNQKQLNEAYELAQFQLGVQYIFFIDLFYFTCFYVFLQPCTVYFSLVGFFLMYWLQKHTLLGRSKRPTPSSAVLNEVIGQLVGFCPCMLSIGQFIWFNLIREDFHNFSDGTYVSHLVALGCSALFFLLPFNAIFNAFCSIPDDEDLIYDEVRQQLTSQYDLLNPATADEALEEFLQINGKPKKSDATNATIIAKMNPKINYEKQKKTNIVKVARKDLNTTEQNIFDLAPQTQFIADLSAENENFLEKYPLRRPRRQRKVRQTALQSKKFGMEPELSGHHAGALTTRENQKNSPYKDLQF